MKRLFLILLICTFSILSYAQTAFSELARAYARSGNYEEAIRVEEKSLEILSLLPENLEKRALVLANMASYHEKCRNFEKALQLQNDALSILSQLSNSNQELKIEIMIDLAYYYLSIGNYSRSIEVGNDCYDIIKSNIERYEEAYLTCSNNLAVSYRKMGEYEKAFRLSTEALDILSSLPNRDRGWKISPLLMIADYYLEIGDYTEAINNAESALNIVKSLKGDNSQLSRILNTIAKIYADMGEYQEAIKYGEESAQLRKLIEGGKSEAYAIALRTLSILYAANKNYIKAIEYGELAKSICLSIYGDSHPEYQEAVHSLATLYSDLGNYHEAAKLEEEVVNKFIKLACETHPTCLAAMSGMAVNHAYLGQFEEAINIGLRIDSNLEKHTLNNTRLYRRNLTNLSWFYMSNNKSEQALLYAKKSIAIHKNMFGEDHIEYYKALNCLPSIYSQQGKLKKAIHTRENILRGIKKSYGEEHHLYVFSMVDLVTKYNHYQDNKNLRIYAPQAFELIRDQYISDFSLLTSLERTNIWSKYNQLFYKTYPLLAYNYGHGYEKYIAMGYDATLFSKGALLNSEIEFKQRIEDIGSIELKNRYRQLRMLCAQLNKSFHKPLSQIKTASDSLRSEINTLERYILKELSKYQDYTNALNINWSDIRSNLNKNEAAIEFVSFPLNNDSTMYMAYILKHDMEVPELIKLFEEKDLTKMINEDGKTNIYTDKRATELIWGKLESQVEGVENVYFAPDGILHQIAIEYFPDFDGEGKISDRWNLHRLSSTREIALNSRRIPSQNTVIYGGIKYDTDIATMEEESQKYDHTKTRGSNSYYNLEDSLASRGNLEYLQGSLIEAKNINSMMEENHYCPMLLLGNEATEESFKNLSGKANGIIHISTHGFYWSEDRAERKARFNDRLLFMSQYGDHTQRSVEDKALTRTGLYMAGAKNTLAGTKLPEDVDDGLLTEQEIANLDLRGLDLVVLSACQTGMGDISGDGVFGLQRGFKKAGANTILMSLWDVSDEATRNLMTEFYKNYLNGQSKRESLLAAQKVVRETPGFEDPEYWAAFILLDALN